jgi:hypothetical protein
MHTVIKIAISLAVILGATTLARKAPAAAGLIGVMPLTGALVLVWTYQENKEKPQVMEAFATGALWGIIPSIPFFVVALVCIRAHLS